MAPPAGSIFFGPFWPSFSYWQCQKCFSPLRFRLLPYYVASLVALLPGMAFLAFLHLLGYADSLWTLIAIPVVWVALYWLVVRIATVEVGQ